MARLIGKDLEAFGLGIAVTKTVVEGLGEFFHALLAIGHHHDVAVGAQAGRRDVVVVLLPVAQIGVEIRHAGQLPGLAAGIGQIAPHPFLDIPAHAEQAVVR